MRETTWDVLAEIAHAQGQINLAYLGAVWHPGAVALALELADAEIRRLRGLGKLETPSLESAPDVWAETDEDEQDTAA